MSQATKMILDDTEMETYDNENYYNDGTDNEADNTIPETDDDVDENREIIPMDVGMEEKKHEDAKTVKKKSIVRSATASSQPENSNPFQKNVTIQSFREVEIQRKVEQLIKGLTSVLPIFPSSELVNFAEHIFVLDRENLTIKESPIIFYFGECCTEFALCSPWMSASNGLMFFSNQKTSQSGRSYETKNYSLSLSFINAKTSKEPPEEKTMHFEPLIKKIDAIIENYGKKHQQFKQLKYCPILKSPVSNNFPQFIRIPIQATKSNSNSQLLTPVYKEGRENVNLVGKPMDEIMKELSPGVMIKFQFYFGHLWDFNGQFGMSMKVRGILYKQSPEKDMLEANSKKILTW